MEERGKVSPGGSSKAGINDLPPGLTAVVNKHLVSRECSRCTDTMGARGSAVCSLTHVFG